MEFYTEDILNKIKKQYKKCVFLMIISLIIVVIMTTLGFVFMSKNNRNILVPIMCVVDILGLFVFTFITSTSFSYSYRYKIHLSTVMKSSPVEVNVLVENISEKPITLSSGLRCYQINVKTDEWKKQYYLADIFDISSLEVNKEYVFYIASSYIKEVR